MTTIAHISDPHFGTVDVPVRDALLRELRGEHIDLVVLTGDITQRARAAQFREAREFLDALKPKPWIAIPGNHDIPLFDVLTRAFKPYRLFNRFISDDLQPTCTLDDVVVLCFNSTSRTRHKNGVLPARAVKQLADRMRTLSQPFKIVATHQPLAVTLDSEIHNVARGASRALDHWIDAGADLFIGGHIHLPYCTLVHAPLSAKSAVVLQAGTAVSLRVRHGVPNSFNRLVFDAASPDVMRLERCDYDTALTSFTTTHTYIAQRGPTGWVLA
jgi:3',5'-cyclic AMP phosphodiesterase CpdA